MSVTSLLLICLLCILSISSRCREPMPAQCREFYSMTAVKQVEVFKLYPLERQYEIYRCGTTQRHPPAMGLSIYIAEGGEKNIPFLLEKLGQEESESMQRYIILVFEMMAGRGYLRGRTDVVKGVEQAVDKMSDSFLKEVSQESLKKINESL
jgi:hypothetical protein